MDKTAKVAKSAPGFGAKYTPSSVATLKVARVSELGAFLNAGTGDTKDDILLHKTQQTAPVAVGDEVKVFLYLDPKRRLTASMRVPQMKIGQVARLKVINVSKDGAFVDVGAERGIFMPFAGMRGRPKIGERVWARLYEDKSGRLAVTMEVEDALRRAARPATDKKVGDTVQGEVYNITDRGIFIFTDERHIVFVDNKEITARPKVGESVTARITYVRPDGRLNASLREQKEKALFSDAEAIFAYMTANGGSMPYGDKTAPEVIRARFSLSKAAFKRALGHLLKEKRIEEKEGWTYIVHP